MSNVRPEPGAPGRAETYSPDEPVDLRMVNLMRLILATSALVIIYVDPSEPDRLVPVTYTALALYTAYSALLYVLAVRRSDLVPARYCHWIDVACYLLLISLSSGTSSIFFFFFFFATLVASFRLGFSEGLAVAVVSASLFTALGYLTAPGGQEFELNRFLLRPVYLLALGYMFAYWGGREATFKRRLAFLKEVSRLSNPRFGLDHTICSLMERLRAFYDADACVFLLPTPDSADYFIRRADRGGPERALRAERLPARALGDLVAAPPDQTVIFNCRRRWPRLAPRYRTLPPSPAGQDAAERRAEALADTLGGSFVSLPLRMRDLRTGRFYLVCRGGGFGTSDADFLRQAAEQVQPVLENIQLLDNLATEAADRERQRISRDLHDSTIQPYIGFKLALKSLRRNTPDSEPLASEIDDLLHMVEEGIEDLRGYVRGLRRKGPRTSEVLVMSIRRQAEKFRAIYGLDVEVAANGVRVSDRLAAEVFQIVNEGLFNVSKHTGASRAVVRLGCADGRLRVHIENDGLPPNDTFTPRSITERAASVGGQTRVEVRDGHTVVSVEIPI